MKKGKFLSVRILTWFNDKNPYAQTVHDFTNATVSTAGDTIIVECNEDKITTGSVFPLIHVKQYTLSNKTNDN